MKNERVNIFGTLAEASKKWNKRQLREFLLEYSEQMQRFENFMIEEIGAETYADICRDFALKESSDWLKSVGADDDEIREFAIMMEHKEREKS